MSVKEHAVFSFLRNRYQDGAMPAYRSAAQQKTWP